MDSGNEIMPIVVLGIALLLFLIGRELLCWYWKINKSVELLTEQNEILEKIYKEVSKSKVKNQVT